MRILNVDNNYQKASNKNPNFNAWQRTVYRKVQQVSYSDAINHFQTPMVQIVEEVQHRNDTLFFRDGSFWNSLSNYLAEKYRDISKVNVYNYACSNGSETYTFLMSLFSHFKEDFVKKFLPILAKDYDAEAIEFAKSHILPISENEVSNIRAFTNGQFERFFESGQDFDIYCNANYPVKKELIDSVVFTKANVLNDCKNIEPNNSVVFVRNFWPYLSGDNQLKLAKNLYNQLQKNATVVIGQYDLMDNRYVKQADDLLVNAGFEAVLDSELLGLVYEK